MSLIIDGCTAFLRRQSSSISFDIIPVRYVRKRRSIPKLESIVLSHDHGRHPSHTVRDSHKFPGNVACTSFVGKKYIFVLQGAGAGIVPRHPPETHTAITNASRDCTSTCVWGLVTMFRWKIGIGWENASPWKTCSQNKEKWV